ncbi:hypothetical protein GIB67_021334 [Kingdonia uniflora]|uniref:AT-hook motif nuclear-localized protein n=1 Tax=Kingdonia uniflora TaxID=39325 RepID=A0A7J7KZF7_9MAGN|nr:hypothetical protein GIB67_021334 [Kingdonia uniflora]
MEGREGMSSGGVTVLGADAPTNYHISVRSEIPNPNPSSGTVVGGSTAVPTSISVALPGLAVKKKRGRPRKYAPDGTPSAVSMALSPVPISSSAPPPVIDFSAEKRSRGRPAGSVNKYQHKAEAENLGEWVPCSAGANFTPHVITVPAGEDVTMKIISFSQQVPRAICILSANGAISNVTLRQPDSSGGTLTYEGRFEILSLSGSFMPTESGGTRSRSGGMSVSLASPDGRVVGGGVAGLLVAAGPVQVVVGSFLTSNQHEQKPKKHKTESMSSAPAPSAVPISSAEMEEGYNMQGQRPKSNLGASSFRTDWNPSVHTMQDSRTSPTDINVSLPET